MRVSIFLHVNQMNDVNFLLAFVYASVFKYARHKR